MMMRDELIKFLSTYSNYCYEDLSTYSDDVLLKLFSSYFICSHLTARKLVKKFSGEKR